MRRVEVERNNKPIVIGLIVAGAGILLLFALVMALNRTTAVNNIAAVSDNSVKAEDIDPSQRKYINEVNYQGPIKYMELYDYPFGKSSLYKMNKDLQNGTDLAAKEAEDFIKDFMTVSYRDIMGEPELLTAKLSKYADEYGLFYSDVPGYEYYDEEKTLEDETEDISDRYVENELSTEAVFVTSPSLVFEDGYIYCRGVIELSEFGDGLNGDKRCIPAEVMMKQYGDGFKITGVVTMEDYPEFTEASEARLDNAG